MSTRFRWGLALALIGCAAGGRGVVGSPFDAMSVLGGIMAQAQIQAAREAWSRIPPGTRTCFDRALSRGGANLWRAVESGVAPSDPRMAPIAAECAKFREGALKTAYRCRILDEGRSWVETTCNQSYGMRDHSGQVQLVGLAQAVDLYFSGSQLVFVDVETADAKRERQRVQMAAAVRGTIAGLRPEVAGYQSSPSGAVRQRAAEVLRAIDAQADPKALPSEDVLASLRRDTLQLSDLAQSEAQRLDALRRLTSAKSSAEKKARDLPDGLRQRFAALQSEYEKVAAAPSARPKPDKPERAVGPSFDCARRSSTTAFPSSRAAASNRPSQTIIKMRNRILGEYKETCFVTGFIKDDEFGMEREAFTAPCGDNGRTMRTHKIGQRFTSRWTWNDGSPRLF